MTDDSYLVLYARAGAWLGPQRQGVARSLGDAGHYSRDEAMAMCAGSMLNSGLRHGPLPAVPVRLIDALEVLMHYYQAHPPQD